MNARNPWIAALLAMLLLAACGESPASGAEAGQTDGGSRAPLGAAATDQAPADGSIHFVWFSRLQGYGEGVPCTPALTPPLPAAARLTAELEAQGDNALLTFIGDTLVQPASISSAPASAAAALARIDNDLDAMARAGVDIYVPGHGDMLNGLGDLLDRAAARDIPVLLSNVTMDGRDDIKRYMIVEQQGVRLAVLGVIPRQGSGVGTANPKNRNGVQFLPPGKVVRELSRDILSRGEANAIVCLSALTNDANQNLCSIPNLHFMIGSSNANVHTQEVVRREGTTMFLQRIAGRALALTTFRWVNDDWNLADISQRHVLPAQLATEREALAKYEQTYGSSDPEVLAPMVIPANPETFLTKYELIEENEAWLEKASEWPGSYLDHQTPEAPALADDDPVRAVLARHGSAIRASINEFDGPLQPLDSESAIPVAEDCQSCHQNQYDFWANTGHATSYDLLLEQEREYDSSCLVCHVAGFGRSGGFLDPRHAAPYGGITCYTCHQVQTTHVINKRLVVDPLYIGASKRDEMTCSVCHNNQRSPEFVESEAFDQIACPPMRFDDPVLLQTRAQAIEAIEMLRARGKATDWDSYLEGRAKVGLGLSEEGLGLIKDYILAQTDWPQMTYFTAQYLQDQGDAAGAVQVLREYLAVEPGNLQMNIAYLDLLTQSDSPEVRDPELALSHASLIAPLEYERLDSVLIPVYIVQIDMLNELGRRQEAFDMLFRLGQRFEDNATIDEALVRYGLKAED